jgi:hypothetical protein
MPVSIHLVTHHSGRETLPSHTPVVYQKLEKMRVMTGNALATLLAILSVAHAEAPHAGQRAAALPAPWCGRECE